MTIKDRANHALAVVRPHPQNATVHDASSSRWTNLKIAVLPKSMTKGSSQMDAVSDNQSAAKTIV